MTELSRSPFAADQNARRMQTMGLASDSQARLTKMLATNLLLAAYNYEETPAPYFVAQNTKIREKWTEWTGSEWADDQDPIFPAHIVSELGKDARPLFIAAAQQVADALGLPLYGDSVPRPANTISRAWGRGFVAVGFLDFSAQNSEDKAARQHNHHALERASESSAGFLVCENPTQWMLADLAAVAHKASLACSTLIEFSTTLPTLSQHDVRGFADANRTMNIEAALFYARDLPMALKPITHRAPVEPIRSEARFEDVSFYRIHETQQDTPADIAARAARQAQIEQEALDLREVLRTTAANARPNDDLSAASGISMGGKLGPLGDQLQKRFIDDQMAHLDIIESDEATQVKRLVDGATARVAESAMREGGVRNSIEQPMAAEPPQKSFLQRLLSRRPAQRASADAPTAQTQAKTKR